MTDETDTAPNEGVTDNVELSDDDTSEDFDYYDPDEDQDTVEDETAEGTDDEADEAKADDEAEDQEAEQSEDEETPDTVTVKMDDGAEVPLGELKKGYLRQNDYTRKQQALSNDRKAVEADVQRMQRITESFVTHISDLVPEAPEASLALSDPNAYVAQKAQHEAAMAQVQKLIEAGDESRTINAEMSSADLQKAQAEANQKLIEMFPETAGGEGREKFYGGVQAVANDLGFSNEELSSLSDHRIFALAHWARRGMEADKAVTKAKAKVGKAPPATPRKPGQGARKPNGNAAAMRKLSKSGSLRDALSVDFD